VSADEPTLSSPSEERLLRAGFRNEPSDDDFVVSSLDDVDARTRVLALRAATRRQLMDVARWTRALDDVNVNVRREALAQLAYQDVSAELFVEIRGALNDDDPLVVDAAVFALGEQHDLDALSAIVVIARGHEDARCREAAVAALGALGDDQGLEAVIAALEDTAPIRRRAIVALSNFEGPDVEAALEKAKTDRDWQVRAAVDQLTKGEPD
jgi:HEAT repeat protein